MTEQEKEYQRLNELSSEISQNIAALREDFAETADNARLLTTAMVEFRRSMGRAQEIATGIKNTSENILAINTRLGESYVKQNRLNELIKETEVQRKRIVEARESATKKNEELQEKSMDTMVAQFKQLARAHNDKNALLLNDAEIVDRLNSEYQETINFLDAQQEAVKLNRAALERMLGSLDKFNRKATIAQNETKALSGLLNSLSKIPILGHFIDLERAAESAKKGWISLIKDLRDQGKETGGNKIIAGFIAYQLWGKVIDLIKKGITLTIEFDKGVTSMGNTMALTKESARGINSTFYEISQAGRDFTGILDKSFISMKNMSEALASIQESLGVSAMLSDEMIQNQIVMTKQMGLSADEAAGIQKFAVLTGDSAKSILDTSLKQNKSFLSNKKIIAEIAKVNSEISTAYKNQPELIAKAVVQAQKLGMTLDDTRKIADSLLEFESSIEGELKSELLLGKQLNFEKARLLALNGDSAAAAADVVKQAGGLNELTKLNVISRKALAESIGLSAEELTKFAQQEEVVRKLGFANKEELEKRYNVLKSMGEDAQAEALRKDIEKQKNGQILAQDIARASLAARFEEAMNRIKEVFIRMSGPLTKILEFVAGILEHTAALKVALVGVVSLLVAAAVAMTAITGGANLAAAATLGAVGGGIAALGLGTAAAVSDSAIAPNGQIMISTPKGGIVPDKNDYVYTSTAPPSQMLSGNGGNDNSGLEQKFDQLISAVEKSKGVYLDSNLVGSTLGTSRTLFA
jgi:hypothetical protein